MKPEKVYVTIMTPRVRGFSRAEIRATVTDHSRCRSPDLQERDRQCEASVYEAVNSEDSELEDNFEVDDDGSCR